MHDALREGYALAGVEFNWPQTAKKKLIVSFVWVPMIFTFNDPKPGKQAEPAISFLLLALHIYPGIPAYVWMS
jgi:hypothetical protein